jgi:hypothetical protein
LGPREDEDGLQRQGLTLTISTVINTFGKIVSNSTLVWKSFKGLPLAGGATWRELVTAMPIVIFVKALRQTPHA